MVSTLAYFCFLEQLLVVLFYMLYFHSCVSCVNLRQVMQNVCFLVQVHFSVDFPPRPYVVDLILLLDFITCYLTTLPSQVADLGPRALAVSLPFSCVLGLLSSMIASTMGKFISFFPSTLFCYLTSAFSRYSVGLNNPGSSSYVD